MNIRTLAAATTALTALTLAGHAAARVAPNSCPQINAYGADPTGTNDNSAAFSAALAANPVSSNQCVEFGPGVYLFNTALSETIGASSSLTLQGAGADATELRFTSRATTTVTTTTTNSTTTPPTSVTSNVIASIALSETAFSSSFHIDRLSITTGGAGTASGLVVIQQNPDANPAYTAQSDITGVTFRGEDAYTGTLTNPSKDYWTNAVLDSNTSNIVFSGDDFVGVTSGGVAEGVGVNISGYSVLNAAVVFNFTDSVFNYLNYGINYGNYSQGYTIKGSNFLGDTIGIYVPPNESSLDELEINSSQFGGNTASAIASCSELFHVSVENSYFIMSSWANNDTTPFNGCPPNNVNNTINSNVNGILLTLPAGYNISGNSFLGALSTTGTGQNGVVIGAQPTASNPANNPEYAGAISNNTFSKIAGSAIYLEPGSAGASLYGDSYFDTTTNVTNLGSNNLEVDSLNGGMAVDGFLYAGGNSTALPGNATGLAVAWNHNPGYGETDFFNGYTITKSGFDFYQQTSATGMPTPLASITTHGGLLDTLPAGGDVNAEQFISTATTGTAPFTVASSTNVPNLNASSLNGATFANPGAIGSTTTPATSIIDNGPLSSGAITATGTISASGAINTNSSLTAGGTLMVETNTGGTMAFPGNANGLGVTWNHSGNLGETDFFNGYAITTSGFNFYQQTSATTAPLLASITTPNGVLNPLAATATGNVSAAQFTSTAATGTAPFTVASTTNVPNLNASLLNGATFAAPGAIGSATPGSGAFTSIANNGALTVLANSPVGSTIESSKSMFAITTGTNNQSLYMSYDGTANVGFIEASQSGSTEPLALQPRGNAVWIGTSAPTGANAGATLYVNGPAAAASWSQTSDARLKKDIEPLTGALDMVGRLRGVSYEWRAPSEREVGKSLNLPLGERHMGFIAQEVAQVAPSAVNAPKPGSGDIYTLREDDIIPVLVEAVKQQQAEIADLKAQVAALRGK